MSGETPSAPEGYSERLAAAGMSPGWAKREPAMWAKPRPRYVPAVWRYADALAALTEAAAFVSPEFAERRNLIMVNPVSGNHYATCRHLVAAYQLVLPGETARSHRHTPNALRLVLDAVPGIYTLVDGIRVDMAPGDVVLTPQWHWHGHANDSDAPGFWIDFLDVPLVQNLENIFFDHHPDTVEEVSGHDPDSPLRYLGSDILARAREEGDVALGDGQLPTIGLHAIGLGQGQRQHHPGRIDNNIYAVTSGEAHMVADGLGKISVTRGDVVVVPGWHEYSIEGGLGGATLLRVTDEPVFRTLGFRDVGRDG